jgi:hypothetical protein
MANRSGDLKASTNGGALRGAVENYIGEVKSRLNQYFRDYVYVQI